MSDLAGFIKIVIGNRRLITRTVTNLPITNVTITTAWLSIKANETDADGNEILLKTITTTLTTDGQVVDSSGTDGQGNVIFILTPTNTALFVSGTQYHYSIKVKTTETDGYYTPEKGKILAVRDIRQASP